MDQQDRFHIDQKFGEQSKQHSELKQLITKLSMEVAEIKRGVYGDEINKVPGLIDTDRSQHLRIKKLENLKNKFFWVASGVIVAAEGLHFLKDYFGHN